MPTENKTNPLTYTIQFTDGDKVVQQWPGYLTIREADSAIRDADLLIPFAWDVAIVTA